MNLWPVAIMVLILFIASMLHDWLHHCPFCDDHLDYDYHGFKSKYAHCHTCGYCTESSCYRPEAKR